MFPFKVPGFSTRNAELQYIAQLAFLEEIAEACTSRNGVPSESVGRPQSHTSSCKRVLEDIRYDGFHHLSIETPNKKRRRSAGDKCSKVLHSSV